MKPLKYGFRKADLRDKMYYKAYYPNYPNCNLPKSWEKDIPWNIIASIFVRTYDNNPI